MSFNLLIHDDMSIASLMEIENSGGVVLKTPHVGNIYPNNLAIAALGMPVLFYDRTLGTKDYNFHPHKLIVAEKSEVIADPNILTTHSKIIRVPDFAINKPEIGTKLADFHMNALSQAMPNARIYTYTKYIQKNKAEVMEVLEIVTDLCPHLWTRVVDREGKITRLKADNWSDIIKFGVYGLTNSESGWIIPNVASILFHATIDASKANVADVYLLSGPDMYRYIDGYQDELNIVYDYVREKSDWNLPEVINCHIIPVSDMRFVVETENTDALNILVNTYLKFVAVEDFIKNNFKKTSGASINELIKKKYEIKEDLLACISESVDTFRKTIFYSIEDGNYFSQHDLIEGKGLYVHSWAIESKLSDVSRAFNLLRKYYLLVADQL